MATIQITNHPRIPEIDGKPVKRYTKYISHSHNEELQLIQIAVRRLHRIDKDIDGIITEISLSKLAPDDVIILEANMENHVDQNGTRVNIIPEEIIPAVYDSQDPTLVITPEEIIPAHYPLNSVPEYLYWYYVFTLPQILWDVLEYNIADQVSKGAFDIYLD